MTEYAPEQLQSNQNLIKNAHKIFLVLDLSSPTLAEDANKHLEDLKTQGIAPEKIWVVGQKSDLISTFQSNPTELLFSLIPPYRVSPKQLYTVSALHKNGLDALLRLPFLSTVPVSAVPVAAGQVRQPQQQPNPQHLVQPVASVARNRHKQFRLPSNTTLTMPSEPVKPNTQASEADRAAINAIWQASHAYLAPQRSFFRRELHLHRRHWLTEVGGVMQKHQAQKHARTLSLEDMKGT